MNSKQTEKQSLLPTAIQNKTFQQSESTISPDAESFVPMSSDPLYAQNKTLEAYLPGRTQSTNSFK